jgi:hypothetical protein
MRTPLRRLGPLSTQNELLSVGHRRLCGMRRRQCAHAAGNRFAAAAP